MVHEVSDGLEVVDLEGLEDALFEVEVVDDWLDALLVDCEVLDLDVEVGLVDVHHLVQVVV